MLLIQDLPFIKENSRHEVCFSYIIVNYTVVQSKKLFLKQFDLSGWEDLSSPCADLSETFIYWSNLYVWKRGANLIWNRFSDLFEFGINIAKEINSCYAVQKDIIAKLI